MNFVEEETPLVLVLQMNSILLPFQDSSETVIISGDEVHDIPSANFAISSLTSEDEIRDQASQSEISGELLLQVDERNSRDVSPDKIEMNPDILKAELAFYASPRTEAYENAVYSTLKNIELTCANDFTTFCGISPMAASSFELLAPMPLNSALFYSNSFIVQGMPTVTNGEPIYTDENEMLTIENPRNLRGKNGLNHRQLFDFFSSNGRSNDRLDVVTAQPGVFEAFDRDHEHHMEPGGDHPDHPAPKGPDEDHRDHPGSGGPDGDHHHPGDHQHHDHPGPGGPDDGRMGPPSPYEDDNDEDYLPSLGYGDDGDMCMLSNFVKLSPNCQSAVNDLLYLRQQYMVEESHGRHGHGPHGPISPLVVLWFPVFGILTLVVGVIYRNRLARNRKYKEDTRTMLAAIEANPALKAQRKFPILDCSLPADFRYERLRHLINPIIYSLSASLQFISPS